MLGAFNAVKSGVRLQRNAVDVRVQLFQAARRTGKRSAGAEHGVGDACVATGRVEEYLTGSEFPQPASLGQDISRGPVFDRSSGIEPLGLAQDLHVRQVASQGFEPYQGRVANTLQGVLTQAGTDGNSPMCCRVSNFRDFGRRPEHVERKPRDYRNVPKKWKKGYY